MNIFSSALAVVLLASTTSNAFTTTSSSSSSSSFSTKLHMSKIDGRTIDGGKVVPTNNFVLVKVVAAKEQTEGGILLTGKSKIQKTEGSVVSVGPGKTHPDTGAVFVMPVVEGDNVVYGEFDGTEIDIDGDKHTLIRDDDILIKFTGDELTLDSCSAVRDSVLVYVETKETSTEGGILIASTKSTNNRPSTGKVVKVGPGRFATNGELMDMEINEGDHIKFRDFAGNEIEINDEEYTVVHALDILAKF
jgi:chaperonin GroES